MKGEAAGLRRWALPGTIALILLVWCALSGWILPEVVGRAYRGEGFEWLGSRMGGRGSIPVEVYLEDLAGNALRISLMLGLLLVLSFAQACRRLTATQPWLEPAPLRDLAVLRLVAVGFQLVLLLWPGVPLPSVTTDPGYNALLAMTPSGGYEPILAMKILLPGVGRPGVDLLWVVWSVCVGSCALGLVGLGGRIPLLVAAWSTSVLVAHGYSYTEYHHPEALHAMALWLVAFTPSTRVGSLDEFRARAREARESGRFRARASPLMSPHARWPLTLLGLFFAMTYFDAAIEKILNAGLAWFGGRTLAFHVAVDATRYDLGTGIWLAQHPALLAPLSYGAWTIEFLFPMALVVAVSAPILALSAVAMHLGIWVIHGPPFFQHMALLPLPFQEQFRDARARWVGRPEALRVLYDGHCDLCIRSMTGLETLDISGRLVFADLTDPAMAAAVPEVDRVDALSWMHVVDSKGVVSRGFFAFRRLARSMPPLWPVLPILYAPFSSRVGPVVYDAIARRRARRGCRLDL